MIIPSIDLMGGETVQLIGGRERALNAGEPFAIAERFSLCGEIAVVDLDAALGRGDNRALIERLCERYTVRVGGGIRSLDVARRWLDVGAHKIVIGTAAEPELLSALPRDRVIAALDAIDGEVVVEGWQTRTGLSIEQRMRELRGVVGGFLVTFVEREGRMQGTAMERVAALRDAAGETHLTIAGGITTSGEIATLDRMGIDAQVGMALYTGDLALADAFAAPLPVDELWPTVVVDENGRALGQCFSNLESLREALDTGSGVYWSRRRGLWRKGETSGATQRLLAIAFDCDRDSLRFTVSQRDPGFCHRRTRSCWGDLGGLPTLARRLGQRVSAAPEGSYTRRLLDEPALLRAKLLEEAQELAEAKDRSDVRWEAADLMYFTLVAMARAGVSLADVERELDRRALRVTRRTAS